MEEYTEKQGYDVYVKLNANNEVIEINSEIFIDDFSGWTLIDKNVLGDKGAHAQGNYLEKSIFTELGDYTYEYVDGVLREKDHSNSIARHEKEMRIAELKLCLANTDYKAIKYAEGVLSEEEFAETKAQRQAWRDEINTLTAVIQCL